MVLNQLDQTQQLEQSLWASADVLRSKMDAAEYKNYLLGLVFYRFLSQKALQAFAENAEMDSQVADKIEATYTTALTKDTDEAKTLKQTLVQKLGFYIDPAYLYTNLVKSIQMDGFEIEHLETAFHNLETSTQGQVSEPAFAGIFADIDLHSNKLGGNLRQRNQVISDTMMALNDIDLWGHNGDLLGDAYEALIAHFASDAGKKVDEFYTPQAVSEIMARMVTNQRPNGDHPVHTIYDPTMGSGSLLLTTGKRVASPQAVKYIGQDLNTSTYNLARMNLIIHGVPYENMKLRNADTLDNDWPVEEPYQFDAVVMNPPYSAHWDNNDERLADPRFRDYGELPPKTKADYAFLLHGLYHLKNNGTMAMALPHGVLFRGAKEGQIRQQLIENNQIDAVIGLPANIFNATSIPTLILVLKKDKTTSDVMFIDASHEFEKGKNQNKLTLENIDKIVKTYQARQDVDKYAHVATYDEIKRNEFKLNIKRYVDMFEPEPQVDLTTVSQELQSISKAAQQNKEELIGMLKPLITNDDQTGANDFIKALEDSIK